MDSGGGECGLDLWTWFAMIELMALCREKGWVLALADGNHYVVTTGTSASAAAGQDEEEREGEIGERRCRAVANVPR